MIFEDRLKVQLLIRSMDLDPHTGIRPRGAMEAGVEAGQHSL